MEHVLVGTNIKDADTVKEAARSRTKRVRDWVVPKAAQIGDRVVLFTHAEGFLATASVASNPYSSKFRNAYVYRADLADVSVLPHPVPLEHVADKLPDWGWPRARVKSRTTPKGDLGERLEAIVKTYGTKRKRTQA